MANSLRSRVNHTYNMKKQLKQRGKKMKKEESRKTKQKINVEIGIGFELESSKEVSVSHDFFGFFENLLIDTICDEDFIELINPSPENEMFIKNIVLENLQEVKK